MPKLKIIYDVPGWAFHNEALALRKYAPPDFEVSLAPLRRGDDPEAALGESAVDVVFALPESQTPHLRDVLRARRWPSRLMGAASSGWPLRLEYFYTNYRVADAVIINNVTAWERTGRLPRTFMIPNGVDLEIFCPMVPPERRRPKVLWVGSEIYRSVKGYDQIMLPLRQKLEVTGIACELLLVESRAGTRRSPEQMADWYNAGTVLVCASETEGTPNPALEAAACGCTVVSTRVGNMPELIIDGVNGYLVERTVDALFNGVTAACANYLPLTLAMQDTIRAWSWKDRSAEFYRLFRQLLASDLPRPQHDGLSETA